MIVLSLTRMNTTTCASSSSIDTLWLLGNERPDGSNHATPNKHKAMKITFVEYGETHTHNYNAKRLTYGAEVAENETADQVLDAIRQKVKDELSGKKEKIRKLRKQAETIEDIAKGLEAGTIEIAEVGGDEG